MRIRVLSDLHLEAAPFAPPAAVADVVVLAGDIANGAAGIEWARRAFDGRIVYVAGNHEPYDGEFHATRTALHAAAAANDVALLDCGECVIGGVRFLGCTLWTDYAVAGDAACALALGPYNSWLADYRAIKWGERRFTAADSLALHAKERAWLAD